MSVIINPNASLQLLIEEEVAQLALNVYPVLNRIQKKVHGQQVIKWNVDATGAAVTGEATSADITTYSEDAVVGASLPIGTNRLRTSFQVQLEDLAQAKNAGVGALRDLFAYEIQSGIRVILEKLSSVIYIGDGSSSAGGVVGLNAVVAAAPYANVDPTSYALWSAFVSTNGTNRALTAALMQSMETGILNKASNYTALYCAPAIVETYKKIFSTAIINPQLNNGIADLGFSGVTYAGRPIIADPYCPANVMYFANEPEIALYTYSQGNTQDQNGLQFAIGQLPSANPDSLKYAIYLKPQLKVHTRSKGVAALQAIQ